MSRSLALACNRVPRRSIVAGLCTLSGAALVFLFQRSSPALASTLLVTAAVAAVAVYDAFDRRIPEAITLPAIFLVLAASFVQGDLLYSAVGAGVTGGGLFALRLVAGSVLGVEAMGFGDVVLAFLIGLGLGPLGGIVAVAVGSTTGLLIDPLRLRLDPRPEAPFGTYLALGTLLTLSAGSAIASGIHAPLTLVLTP